MKVIHNRISFYVFLVFAALLWQGCCMTNLHFSGKIVSKDGVGISGAIVSVGSREENTNDKGEFDICVKKAEKYILNVAAPKFGFVSKVYSDTASKIVITMAKATVESKDPNQDIVVEDVNPEMTIPASAQASAPASPLDTIPFVYDAQGHLISFTMPQALKETYQAVAQFQPPRRGARISIPAQSLVLEGSDKLPEGNVDISVSTIDLYSPDGMPGDYTVDLGFEPRENVARRGAMISYGAANIEAFYNGKPLQLGGKKTATLTIPVDTLSIISKESIPDEIPFLIYNKTTGLWEQEGTAKLNASRDAYTKEVSHFSTFNMDMVWSGQSCIQLCDKTTLPADLEITVPTKTKSFPLPGASPCSGGTTDCNVYGVSVTNTRAIINLQNNIPVGVRVIKSGMPVSTYAFYSGPAPSGSASVYQSCNYNDCHGPFQIADVNACWETTPNDGTMENPITATQLSGTNVIFSWIYIQKIVGNAISNDPHYYEIEFASTNDITSDFNDLTWARVDFDPGIVNQPTFPISTGAGTTEWRIESAVDFSGANAATNPLLTPTDILLFRVNYGTDGITFSKGAIHVLNLPGSGNFYNTFTSAVGCYTF